MVSGVWVPHSEDLGPCPPQPGPRAQVPAITLPSDLLALTSLPGQARSALEAAAWRQGSSQCCKAALKMSTGHSPAVRASAAESLGRFLWGWWSLSKLGVRTRLHAGAGGGGARRAAS